MESLHQGIPEVTCYIDDIVNTDLTNDEHLANLKEVLNRHDSKSGGQYEISCKYLLNI